MTKGIGIVFTAQNAEVIAASKGVQSSLEDVEDAAKDLGKTSANAWADTAASAEKVDTRLQKYQDQVRKQRQEEERASSEAVDNTKREIDELERKSQALREQTEKLKESSDVVQEEGSALEGAFAGVDEALDGSSTKLLGLVGIAGGLGGAVGQGVAFLVDTVMTGIDNQIAAAQELRDNLVGAYQQASAEGQRYLDQAAIIAAANDILFDTGKREAAAQKAAEIGVTLQTYVRAQAGDIEALNTTLAAAEAAYENVGVAAGAGSKSAQAAAVEEGQSIQAVIRELEGLQETHAAGQAAAETEAAVRTELEQAQRDQIAQTSAASQARWEALEAAHAAAQKLAPINIPAAVDEPDIDGMIDRLQGRARSRKILVKVAGVDSSGREIF